jgi:uncharacterized damage-inducible protein DinB
MHQSIATVAQLYGVSGALYERALEGVSPEDLRRRPGEGTNPLLWIAGHLASVRISVCGMLGAPREVPWGKTFFRGSVVDPDALPGIDGIRQEWRAVTEVLTRRLDEVTADVLEAASPKKFPIPDPTVRGAVAFLAWHEAYHVGQMSLLRRWLGLSGLAG